MHLESMVAHNSMVDAINELNRQHAQRYAEMEAQLAAAERKNRELALALAVSEAHGAGMLAQVRALRKDNPGSYLFKATGGKNRDGSPELVLQKDFYKKAFDTSFKSATGGKINPAGHRN